MTTPTTRTPFLRATASAPARIIDVEAQTAALIDAITGDGRAHLVGLPAGDVYNRLCEQILELGMVPVEGKVRLIARWISDDPQCA